MNQRIIVLEGPDGCGKTEIGKGLAKRIGVPYFKMNTEAQNWRKGKFKEALEFDQTYLVQFLKQTGYSAVIDRAWPSEWVYSRVFKRDTNPNVLFDVDRAFAGLGTRIIIPWREDYSRNRHDDLVPNSKLIELHEAYFDFMEWTACDTIPINVDFYENNLERELSYILQIMEDEGR